MNNFTKTKDQLSESAFKEKAAAQEAKAKEVYGWKTDWKKSPLKKVSRNMSSFMLTHPRENRKAISVSITDGEMTVRVVGETAGYDLKSRREMDKLFFDKKFKTEAEYKKIIAGINKKYDELGAR